MIVRPITIVLLATSVAAFVPNGLPVAGLRRPASGVSAPLRDSVDGVRSPGPNDVMLDLLASYQARTGNVFVPRAHVEDGKFLGRWVLEQKRMAEQGLLDADLVQKLDQLGVFGQTAQAKTEEEVFSRMLSLLAEYKAKAGSTIVPNSYIMDGEFLGAWLTNMRRAAAAGTLEPAYKQRLDELGVFDGKASAYSEDEKFYHMIDLLVEYRESKGNWFVPSSYIMKGEFLGQWLAKQQAKIASGTMEEKYLSRFEELGVFDAPTSMTEAVSLESDKRTKKAAVAPVVNVGALAVAAVEDEPPAEIEEATVGTLMAPVEPVSDSTSSGGSGDDFSAMLNLLSTYKSATGNFFVPHTYVLQGKFLGRWLADQKEAAANGTLDPSKKQQLEDLGVFLSSSLNVSKEEVFAKMLACLADYKEKAGNVLVPRTYVHEGEFLGRWVWEQRAKAKEGSLEQPFKARLEELGVTFTQSLTQVVQ